MARVWSRIRRLGSGGAWGSSGFFGLAVGVLIGVMISALVFPKDVRVVVEGGAPGATERARPGGTADAVGSDAAAPVIETEPSGDQATPDAVAGPAAGSGPAATTAPSGDAAPAGRDGGAATGKVTTLRIGVGVLDLGVIANLGPAFDNGDGEAHMRSFLDGARREGLLPVNGYDVQFVYRRYDPLTAESQRSACRGFVQDDRVLAVLAGSNFQQGAECVAREFATPLVTSDGVAEAAYQRTPFLHTFMMSTDRLLRNWVHWAHRRGALRNKKIGVFYADDAANESLYQRSVKSELSRLGYTVTAEAAGSTQPTGGPQDAVAAQRFQAAGVEVVFMMGPPTAFTQRAEQQGYRPLYLATDYFSGTTNTATSNVPPSQYDGALAMTGVRYGEWRAGMANSPAAAKCQEWYARASGRRVDGNAREAEWIGMNKLCDGGWALLDALRRAKRGGLDKPALAAALDTVTGLVLGVHDDVTFRPGRHDGTRRQRTLQWAAGCRCWKAQGGFEPLPAG